MCGITGFITTSPLPYAGKLATNLRKLEYRGYDSAGAALLTSTSTFATVKMANMDSSVENGESCKALVEQLSSESFPGHYTHGETAFTRGIAHTRWSTHGPKVNKNCHPHMSYDSAVAVVHNGTIDNFAELRDEVVANGVTLSSDTDTEVVAHLIARARCDVPGTHARISLAEAVRAVLPRLVGTYGLVVMSTDPADPLVLASLGSPLVVGKEVRNDGTLVMWAASDYVALLGTTSEHCFLDDSGSVTEVYANGRIISSNAVTAYTPTPGEEVRAQSKYQHAMLAEIFEQPETLARALAGRLGPDGTITLGCLSSPVPGFASLAEMLADTNLSIRFAAQGTSQKAGIYGAELFRMLTNVPTQVTYGSELKSAKRVGAKELCFLFSQSGETADTRDGGRNAKRLGAVCFGMTNRPSSVIVRDTHVGLHLHAGIETAVASTKAFTAQAVCSALLVLETARVRGTVDAATYAYLASELARVPACIREVLHTAEPLCEDGKVAVPLDSTHAFFLGHGVSYALADEAALKVQEVGYVHAHAFHLSELKHGPLALVQPGTPVYAFVPDDETSDAVGTALTIAHTNGARIYTIGTHVPKAVEGKVTYHYPTPTIAPELFPIIAAPWVQLISAYTGLSRGNNIDKPRNLAKSVTV